MQNQISQFEATSIVMIKRHFDFELQVMCICMMGKVVAMMDPFFSFAITHNVLKAHNMFTLILYLWFNSCDTW
jgi:hypothetical protein